MFAIHTKTLFTTYVLLTTTHPHSTTNLHTSLALWLTKCKNMKICQLNKSLRQNKALFRRCACNSRSVGQVNAISPNLRPDWRVPPSPPPTLWQKHRWSRTTRAQITVSRSWSYRTGRQVGTPPWWLATILIIWASVSGLEFRSTTTVPLCLRREPHEFQGE